MADRDKPKLPLKWKIVAALGISLFAFDISLAAGFWLGRVEGLTINSTTSMPPGVYQRLPVGTLHRGDIVIACMPEWAVDFRRAVHLPFDRGSCIGNAEPVLKRVAALPGDRVVVRIDGVYVNGMRWQGSAFHRKSSNGALLPDRYLDKTVVVRAGQVWLLTHNPMSFDSRYWGPAERVLFRARPIWTTYSQER